MTNEELKTEIRTAYKEGFYAALGPIKPGTPVPNWEYEYIESRAYAVATGRWSRSTGLTVCTVPFNGEATNPIPPLI